MFLYHEAHSVSEFMEGYRFNPIVIMPFVLFFLFVCTAVVDPSALWNFFVALVVLAPFWLPIFLLSIFWVTWMHYIRYIFWFSRKTTLWEIQLPPDVVKSPLAMELFLISLYNTGAETTFIHRFWKGGFRPTWSLEIASNEGRIGYYLHGPKIWESAVSSRIYGQFPDAKVIEVEDYVDKVPFNLEEYEIWCGEYRKPNPGALPIVTYIDFALDKDTDTPETKVDPMTNVLEILNNMGKDEYTWIQIIIRSRGNDEWYGIYDKKNNSLTEPAKKEIQDIMAGAAKRAGDVLKASDVVEGKMNALLTERERDKIKAIEHSLSKHFYECGIRALYIAKKNRFQGINGAFLYRLWQPFRSDFNNLSGTRGMVAFDYPWEDWGDIRQNYIKKEFFFFYKHRAYFYVPLDQEMVFLNTEELATLWRFPGSAVKTPGLNRTAARLADAPPNLPTLPS